MRRRPVVVLVAVGLLGAAAALVALRLVRVEGPVGPGVMELRLVPAVDGRTDIGLPPLGRVTADTHRAPVTVEARLDQLNVEEVQDLVLAERPDAAALAEVRDDLRPLLTRLLLYAAAVGAVAGMAAAALLPGRRWSWLGAGGAGGLVAVVAITAVAVRSYEPAAFGQPSFHGPLERAPQVIEAVRRHVDSFDEVRGRLDALSVQVADLYGAATAAGPGDDAATTVILHVSDIHSNPIGLELSRRLVASFGVDAVLDTGDLTSFGLPLEARLGELVTGFGVPYLYVPGNHDSAANRAAIAALPGVQLLDGDTATVGEVRILGVADPTYTADNEMSTAEANRAKEGSAPSVARLVRSAAPDVLAVHDARQAGRATGLVPVIVAGHTHQRAQRLVDDSLVLTVGSSGATGLEAFLVQEDRPYEMQLLRFDGDRLVAVDYVEFTGVEGNFRVSRRTVDPPLVARPDPGATVRPT